jgi:hypothetical protein
MRGSMVTTATSAVVELLKSFYNMFVFFSFCVIHWWRWISKHIEHRNSSQEAVLSEGRRCLVDVTEVILYSYFVKLISERLNDTPKQLMWWNTSFYEGSSPLPSGIKFLYGGAFWIHRLIAFFFSNADIKYHVIVTMKIIRCIFINQSSAIWITSLSILIVSYVVKWLTERLDCMMLVIHLHWVTRLRICGAILSLLHTSWCGD